MGVMVQGKVVTTDTRIYEFADASVAEKFINCLVSMDELASCQQVPAVSVTARPGNVFSGWRARLSNIVQQLSGRPA